MAETSGPFGSAPPLMASPTDLEIALRSAFSPSDSPEQRPPSAVELDGRVDDRGVLALLDGTLAQSRSVVTQALQADAHAGTPAASRSRSSTKPGSRLASSQPARGPLGRPRKAR